MRRTVLLLASIALAVVLVGGAALAATISCAGGFQRCKGTEEADVLRGAPKDTPELDRMIGLGGDDELYAEAGDDFMEGGLGDDLMSGGPGNDSFRWFYEPDYTYEEATAGNDTFYGGKGHDEIVDFVGYNRLFGGSGGDDLRGHGYFAGRAGNDTLVLFDRGKALGGEGSDKIDSHNGVSNNVSCGVGTDTAYADRADVLSGCERVRFRDPGEFEL